MARFVFSESRRSASTDAVVDDVACEAGTPKFQKKLLCRSSALRAERDLRLYFESKGYEVEGGKDLLKTE